MAVIRLFLDSGMRLSELAALRLGDVDLDHRVAIVIGKGRRPWACPFGAKTASALDRYLHLRARDPDAATSDALWLGARGPPYDRSVTIRHAEVSELAPETTDAEARQALRASWDRWETLPSVIRDGSAAEVLAKERTTA